MLGGHIMTYNIVRHAYLLIDVASRAKKKKEYNLVSTKPSSGLLSWTAEGNVEKMRTDFAVGSHGPCDLSPPTRFHLIYVVSRNSPP